MNTIVNKYCDLTEKTFLYHIDIFINDYLSILKKEEGLNLYKGSPLIKNFINYTR